MYIYGVDAVTDEDVARAANELQTEWFDNRPRSPRNLSSEMRWALVVAIMSAVAIVGMLAYRRHQRRSLHVQN